MIPWEHIDSFKVADVGSRDYVEMVFSEASPDWDEEEAEGARIRIDPVYGALPLTLANVLNDWKSAIAGESNSE